MAVRVTGKVLSINADRLATIIQLDNDPGIGPLGNVWNLLLDHGNYNALYSLAIAAAANRWPLTIRVGGDGQIDPHVEATIKSLEVVW